MFNLDMFIKLKDGREVKIGKWEIDKFIYNSI